MHLTFILTVTTLLLIEIGKCLGESSSSEVNRSQHDFHGYLPSPQAGSGPLEPPVPGVVAGWEAPPYWAPSIHLLPQLQNILFPKPLGHSLENKTESHFKSQPAHGTVKIQHVSE